MLETEAGATNMSTDYRNWRGDREFPTPADVDEVYRLTLEGARVNMICATIKVFPATFDKWLRRAEAGELDYMNLWIARFTAKESRIHERRVDLLNSGKVPAAIRANLLAKEEREAAAMNISTMEHEQADNDKAVIIPLVDVDKDDWLGSIRALEADGNDGA